MAKGQHYARSGYTGTRRKRHSKLPLVIVAVLAILAILAVLFFLVSSCGDTKGDVKQGQQIEVVIPAGSSTDQIADILVKDGVVASKREFVDHAEKLGKASNLQSGSYVLTGGADLDSIVQVLISGKTGHQLVIPEGYNLKQISAEVEKTCGIDADEFYNLTQQASSYANDFPFLKNVYNNSMEGFLYPDTYRVETYATADDVIRMMLKQFQTEISKVDMSYAASKNLTLFDVVTLSSIVEKEYKAESDKPLIAAVFYNRLHAGIVLGSDVTTYYAVGKDMTEELTAQDLASDSPYNTRNPSHYGLPAGPICSPSISTITATANPSQVDYLYFFYSNSKGQTMFFSNDADFNAAWAQYGN